MSRCSPTAISAARSRVRWIGLPIGVGGRFGLRTASIGILAYDPAHPEVPVIALWNEVPSGRG